jgi:hypothetical protein
MVPAATSRVSASHGGPSRGWVETVQAQVHETRTKRRALVAVHKGMVPAEIEQICRRDVHEVVIQRGPAN